MIRTLLWQFQNTWHRGWGFDVSGEFVYSGVANSCSVRFCFRTWVGHLTPCQSGGGQGEGTRGHNPKVAERCLTHHNAKPNKTCFDWAPSPNSSLSDPTASWGLGGLALLIYRAQSPCWRRGLGHAFLALRVCHGESPGVRRRKGLKIPTERERQHLVLGCTEISTKMQVAILFPSLCPTYMGN